MSLTATQRFLADNVRMPSHRRFLSVAQLYPLSLRTRDESDCIS